VEAQRDMRSSTHYITKPNEQTHPLEIAHLTSAAGKCCVGHRQAVRWPGRPDRGFLTAVADWDIDADRYGAFIA